MSLFNKLYKFIFRKKVQKKYDALLTEKNTIEAEIAKIKKQNITDKLKALDSMQQEDLINDSEPVDEKRMVFMRHELQHSIWLNADTKEYLDFIKQYPTELPIVASNKTKPT